MNNLQAKNRQDATQTPTGISSTAGDLDVWMPGAYLGDSTLDALRTSMADTAAAPTEPATQPQQTRRVPAQFQDILPEPPVPAFAPQSRLPAVYLLVTNPLETITNSFGLFRQYLFHPSYDPDSFVDPSDLSNLTTHTLPPPPVSNETSHKPPWPFVNMSVWRLMHWMNTGSKSKSEGEVDRLVNGVLNAPDFHTKDLHNFSAHHENGRLDTADKTSHLEDGFQVTSITI